MRSLVLRRAFALAATLLLIAPNIVSGAVRTDQEDYTPGSVVTISGDNSNGAGYVAGETVDVVVSGPNGYAASCSATADESGAWSCQVTLWNSLLAVGDYSYTATGQTSGVSETGTFTDNASINIDSATFVWHRTGEVTNGFDVAAKGAYLCTPGSGGNNCTGVTSITLSVDGLVGSSAATFASSSWSDTLTFRTTGGEFGIPPDGKYRLVASMVTTGGTGTKGSQANDYFGVDNTAPTNTIQCNSAACAGPYAANVQVQIQNISDGPTSKGSGVASTQYCVDTTNTCTPGTPYPGGSGFTVTYVAGGTNYVRYRSTDNVGNAQAIQSQTIAFSSPNVATTTSASNASATYGDSSVTLNATVTPASGPAVNTGTVTFTVNGTPVTSGTVTAGAASASLSLSGFNAGEYNIAATYNAGAGFLGSDNSTQSPTPKLTFSAAELTVTPDAQNVSYGDAAPGASFYTFDVTGFISGENAGNAAGYAAPSCTSDYTQGMHVSDSPRVITCSGGSATNYTFDTSATAGLTIDGVTLTVTPDAQSVTYGDAAPAGSFYTFDVTGFIPGENAGNAAGYTAPSCTSDYAQGHHVADSPRTISCSGGSATDYTFDTTATADLTIDPAGLTVTPDAQSVTYGDAAPGASFYTFDVTGFVLSEDETTADGYTAPSCTSDYTQGMHVADGPRDITCSGGSADDYTFDTTATADLTINPATLTVTPDAQSVTYGDAAPADSFYTFDVTGFVLSEDETTADGYTAPSCTSDYTQGMHVADGPRDITCSGGSADDYTFDTTATADLTIEKLELTPVFTVANKYFNNSTNATIQTVSATGQFGTDVCTLSGGTTAFPTSAVGGPYTLTLTGWSLAGADCADYQISSDPTTTASILAWDAGGHGFYPPVGIVNSVFTPAPGTPPTTPGGLAWNTAKGGSTIPLKFQVFAGPTELTDTSTPYPITSFNATKMSNCGSDATASDVVDFTTTGGTSLRYDASAHQWIQNWKTPNVSSETCYRAWVTFADGSTLEAFFKLKK